MKKKLVIFDVDGTLVQTKSGAKFRKQADDWEWILGRLERLEELHNQDIKLGIATNQGGIAFGYLNADQIIDELFKMATEGHIYYTAICSTHPEATIEQYKCDSFRRKPGAGMIYELLNQARCSPSQALMVGDREEDQQAAEAAGIDFQKADEFFLSNEALKWYPNTLADWQVAALHNLLQTDCSMVEPTRLYTSSERYGTSRYHLTELVYNGIQIEQIEVDEKWGKRVVLHDEELPAFLKTLIERYLSSVEKQTKKSIVVEDNEDVLGDMDDHPF